MAVRRLLCHFMSPPPESPEWGPSSRCPRTGLDHGAGHLVPFLVARALDVLAHLQIVRLGRFSIEHDLGGWHHRHMLLLIGRRFDRDIFAVDLRYCPLALCLFRVGCAGGDGADNSERNDHADCEPTHTSFPPSSSTALPRQASCARHRAASSMRVTAATCAPKPRASAFAPHVALCYDNLSRTTKFPRHSSARMPRARSIRAGRPCCRRRPCPCCALRPAARTHAGRCRERGPRPSGSGA